MGKASRVKGAAGEREVAAIFQAAGFDVTRNARNGISTDDLATELELPGFLFEVKRRERIDIHAMMRQAHFAVRTDPQGVAFWNYRPNAVPVGVFRRSRTKANWPTGEWHATLPLDDLMTLLWKAREYDRAIY